MTSWNHEAVVSFVGTTSGTLPGPTDLHVVVLSWDRKSVV